MPDQMTSATQIFPDQILLDILTRLPAKTACRFKLVSKRFNSLISHPHFTRTYISRATKTWCILDRIVRVTPSQPTGFNLDSPPRVSSLSVTTPILDVNSSNSEKEVPTVIVTASNGLVLVGSVRERDPHKEREKDTKNFSCIREQQRLFVMNPVTDEWTPLPLPRQPFSLANLAFTARVDDSTGLIDRFLVVQYMAVVGTESAIVSCFSSEIGKWEGMKGTYMLNRHLWGANEAFEFDGRLFWIDLGVGLIFLKDDVDILITGNKQKKILEFGFVKLPEGCVCGSTVKGLSESRFIGAGGGGGEEIGCIQFLQVGKKSVKLWRLNDYNRGDDWSLAFKVSFEAEFEGLVPKPIMFHPFQADVVVCALKNRLLVLNVRTKEVQRCDTYLNSVGAMVMVPAVIPSWPSSFPTINGEGAKEVGNEYFKEKKYEEAVLWYTKCIDHSPTAVAYANRAAAHLNLNNFLDAEKDCTESLNLDADFIKAYWRRARARKELGKLGEALKDAEHVLSVNPNHPEMKKISAEIKSLHEQATPDEIVEGNMVSNM